MKTITVHTIIIKTPIKMIKKFNISISMYNIIKLLDTMGQYQIIFRGKFIK